MKIMIKNLVKIFRKGLDDVKLTTNKISFMTLSLNFNPEL